MKILLLLALTLGFTTTAHAQSGFGFAVGPTLQLGDAGYDTGYHAQLLVDSDLPVPYAGLRVAVTYQKFQGAAARTSFFDDEFAIGVGLRLGVPVVPVYVIGGPTLHIRTFEAFGIEGLPNTEIETDFGVMGGVGTRLALPDLPTLFAEVYYQTTFRTNGEGHTEAFSYLPISVGIIF